MYLNFRVSTAIRLQTHQPQFELPFVTGVSDNGVYDTAVCIRVIGAGSATLNGSAFDGEIIVGTSGKHKLVV
jgi:hypothetical protein